METLEYELVSRKGGSERETRAEDAEDEIVEAEAGWCERQEGEGREGGKDCYEELVGKVKKAGSFCLGHPDKG